MKDDIRWKTTFVGRRHVLEDELQWKTLDPCMLASFFTYSNVKKELSHVSVLYFPFTNNSENQEVPGWPQNF